MLKNEMGAEQPKAASEPDHVEAVARAIVRACVEKMGPMIDARQAEFLARSALSAARPAILEEAAKAIEGMPRCPFENGMPDPGLEPTDPCPVCGDLGTHVAVDEPSKCGSPSAFLRSLAKSAEAPDEGQGGCGAQRSEPNSIRALAKEG